AAFQAKGDWKKATEHYREAILRSPKYAPAYDALARALLARGGDEDADRASGLAGKATELWPTYAESYRTLGAALGEHDNWEGAESQFAKAVELDPKSGRPRCLLGDALIHNKQPFQAIKHFARAAELAPRHAPAYAGLGRAHFERGDFKR